MELDSKWLNTQVELYKALEGYELTELNEQGGYVDYISEKGDEKKLLRVLITDNFTDAKGYINDVEEIIQDSEKKEIDKATILAKMLSKASRELVKTDGKISFVSEEFKPLYTPFELMLAVGKKVEELCTVRCGKLPSKEEECKSSQKWEMPCQVRRVSDDADFHAEMQWTDLLYDDFSKLVELEIV